MHNWKIKRLRTVMLLLMAVLAIGFALAQTQATTGQAPAATPAVIATDTPATPAPAAAEATKPTADETTAAAKDAGTAAAAAKEAAEQEAVNQRTVSRMRTTTQKQREQAARTFQRRVDRGLKIAPRPQAPCPPQYTAPCGNADYFTPVPNYALSALPTLTQTSIDPAMPKTYTVTAGTGIKKFVDGLAGLGPANANNLTNYLPIATPITNGTPGFDPWGNADDYYEIGLIDYTMQFHTNLPNTTMVRGYVDLNPAPLGSFRTSGDNKGHYLGPVIIASTDRPVRVKFTNQLVAGSPLFIPADNSYMGMNHMNSLTYSEAAMTPYSKNRASVHLHGGVTPWISDGTPHQWTVPATEFGSNPIFNRGASVFFVPDMKFDPTTHAPSTAANAITDPGNGSLTFYYTNHQSGRLMFYHDHAYGTTRLNVYGGEAAGYLLHDAIMEAQIGLSIPNNAGLDKTTLNLPTGLTTANGGLYHFGIPLVIQDKTFVPPATQLAAQDPTWNWGATGNLWFPHVYMPNQNPNDQTGATIAGRWDYGMWFWPPMQPGVDLNHASVPCTGTGDVALYGLNGTCPGTLNPSGVPESFMDTPVVNGVAYPTITIPAGAYRFQILNAANDRMFNLSLFYAADANGNVCKSTGYLGGFNYAATPAANVPPTDLTTCTEVKMVPATPHALVQAAGAPPTLPAGETPADSDDTMPRCAATPALPDTGRGDGFLVLANPAAIDFNPNTGLPGLTKACWPSSWPTDGRDGGVPDPASAGPPWVQIGTEGGVLPAPVVIPPTPVGYNYNRRDIVVTNVQEHALFIGPAERADVIVDFSQVPNNSALILYNDSPAPVPGYDVRLDYYTGDPDLTSTGGAPTTQPGYGPNIRTIMQIIVAGGPTTANYMTDATGLPALQSAIPGIFYTTQPHIIVPEPSYNATVLNGPPPTVGNYARIQNTTGLSFTPVGGTPITISDMKPKAIHELFEVDYGKMNSILAAELPVTNYNNQTTIPLAYVDPPSEFVNAGAIQLWKVTHNGVDSHAIHFHLFNVQLINRVGWDGAIRPPDPNELGWKETVRMNPLEDAIVALQPILPPVPFPVPSSVRLLDPSRIVGATNTVSQPGFSNLIAIDGTVTGNAANIANQMYDFGWEYVWHCHLLGHEEMDMMRPVVLEVASPAPVTNLTATLTLPSTATLRWPYTQSTTTPATGFQIWQQIGAGPFIQVGTLTTVGLNNTFPVNGLVGGTTYSFKVYAVTATSMSGASNIVTVAFLNPVTNVRTTTLVKGLAVIAWTPPANLTGAAKYQIQRSVGVGNTTFSVVGTTTNLTTTSFPQSGLTTGTTYNYKVVILNAANQAISPASTTFTFVAP